MGNKRKMGKTKWFADHVFDRDLQKKKVKTDVDNIPLNAINTIQVKINVHLKHSFLPFPFH